MSDNDPLNQTPANKRLPSGDQASENLEGAEAQGPVQGTPVNATEAGQEALRGEWGDAFEQNLGIAQRALQHYGNATVRLELERSGLGDNPELIKLFYKMGIGLLEDDLVGDVKDAEASEADCADQTAEPPDEDPRDRVSGDGCPASDDQGSSPEPNAIEPGSLDFLSLPPVQRRPIPYEKDLTLIELAECLCWEWVKEWRAVCSHDYLDPVECSRAIARVRESYPGQKLTETDVDEELPTVIERLKLEKKHRKLALQREIIAELKHALAMRVLDVIGIGPAPDFIETALSPRLLRDVKIELREGTEGVLYLSYEGFYWTSIWVVLHRTKVQAITQRQERAVPPEHQRLADPPSAVSAEIATANGPGPAAKRAQPKRKPIIAALKRAYDDGKVTEAEISRECPETRLSLDELRKLVGIDSSVAPKTVENACDDFIRTMREKKNS